MTSAVNLKAIRSQKCQFAKPPLGVIPQVRRPSIDPVKSGRSQVIFMKYMELLDQY